MYKNLTPILVLALAFFSFGAVAYAEPGTINQLNPWKMSAGNITQTVANTPIKLTGLTPGGCLQLTALNIATTTGSPCSSGGSNNVATSTGETAGQLSYWTSTNATPATLGKVATTTLTLSGFPANIPATLGALVGGSNTTWTWWGLATTSQPSSSNLLVSNGGQGVYGVATSSATINSPLSGSLTVLGSGSLSIADAAADGSTKGAASFTANDFDAATGNISIDYTNGQAASGAAKGFLTSADWTTFNNKQDALTFSYPLQNSANTISLAFGTTTANSWSALQTVANSTTTLATFTAAPWFTSLTHSLLATDATGRLVATTSIGVNYLTGVLPISNGGTGTSTNATTGNVLSWTGGTWQGVATSSLGLVAFNNADCISLTGSADLCDGSDATGGGGGVWPFTPSSYNGVANQSTTTPLWLKDTMVIASTTLFTNASTTNLTIDGSAWLTGLTSSLLSTDSSGKIVATTSVGVNYLTGILPIANGGTATSTQVTNGVNFFDGTRITSGTALTFTGTSLGIGTTTPWGKLSVTGSGTGTGLAFAIADSANAPIFTVQDNGYVGIGTTTPSIPFAFYGTASGNTYADVLASNQAAVFNADFLTTTGAPSSGANQGGSFNFFIQNTNGGSGLSNNYNAFRYVVRASTTESMTGGVSAGNFQGQHYGTNTMSKLRGFVTNTALAGSGSITDSEAVFASGPQRTGSGTITNAYGVRIGSQKIAGVTNGYGVYSEGASDINYFAGTVGIGTTTPNWKTTISNSSGPQLALTDGSLTSNQWTMRNASGILYIATSTYSATSSESALTLNANGWLGIGTSTPGSILSIQGVANFVSGAISTIYNGLKVATELIIPNAADPTIANTGDLAINTTAASSSVRYHDGTAERALFPDGMAGLPFASSTLDYQGAFGASGTTTIKMMRTHRPLTLLGLYCDTDTGTAYVTVGNGSASTTMQCTTSSTRNTTAVTWTMGQFVYIAIGTSASSPNVITVSPDIRIDAD